MRSVIQQVNTGVLNVSTDVNQRPNNAQIIQIAQTIRNLAAQAGGHPGVLDRYIEYLQTGGVTPPKRRNKAD